MRLYGSSHLPPHPSTDTEQRAALLIHPARQIPELVGNGFANERPRETGDPQHEPRRGDWPPCALLAQGRPQKAGWKLHLPVVGGDVAACVPGPQLHCQRLISAVAPGCQRMMAVGAVERAPGLLLVAVGHDDCGVQGGSRSPRPDPARPLSPAGYGRAAP